MDLHILRMYSCMGPLLYRSVCRRAFDDFWGARLYLSSCICGVDAAAAFGPKLGESTSSRKGRGSPSPIVFLIHILLGRKCKYVSFHIQDTYVRLSSWTGQ